jgi:hypothetical protein
MRLTRYLGKTDAGSICRASQALMYPTETGEIRRCVLRQFPYTLRYAVRGDLISGSGRFASPSFAGLLGGPHFLVVTAVAAEESVGQART